MGQSTAAIREEIEETRGRMGDTLEALAYKADVKGRTKDWMADKQPVAIEVGRAGLTGWRAKVAHRASGRVASRTRFTEEQVEAMIGGVFLALATAQFVLLMRKVWRAGRRAA